MPTSEQPEMEVDARLAHRYIKEVLMFDSDEPVNLYMRGDQGRPLVDIPFEIWELWAQTPAPRPRFVLLERNETAAIVSEHHMRSQAGPDVNVKYHPSVSGDVPNDANNENQITIRTVPQFLHQELNQKSRPNETVVVVMHNILPLTTTWDRVWIAGLKAWAERVSPKLRLRCFITSKGPSLPVVMPGRTTRVVVRSDSQSSIEHVNLNHGSIDNRIMGVVRSMKNTIQRDPNARIAFIFDSATDPLILPILQRQWKETGSTGPSIRQTDTNATMRPDREADDHCDEEDLDKTEESQDTSSSIQPNTSRPPTTGLEYETVRVSNHDDLVEIIELSKHYKGPLLLLLTIDIQQLDAYQLGLHSLVVFEPIEKVLQHLEPNYKMGATRCHLSDADIEICKGLLGNCPDVSQRSLVRCNLEDEISRQPFLYAGDMMAQLFLAIGFGVDSPLASDSAIIKTATKPTALVSIQRLLEMKAIKEVDEDTRTATSSSDSISSRKFQLGINSLHDVFKYMIEAQETDLNTAWLQVSAASPHDVFKYMIEAQETDLNTAWLQVSAASLKFPSNYIVLDYYVAMAYLTAVLDPAERYSPILFVNPELSIGSVLRAATNKLPEVLADWQERGSVWYTILLGGIVERQKICLDPNSSDFDPEPEISEGLCVDAKRLTHVKLKAIAMQNEMHIRHSIFDDSIQSITREHLDATYNMFARRVVEAYPHNLVLLCSAHPRRQYAQCAWDFASRVCHGVNYKSLNRVRLRRVSDVYEPVLAIYFTLRSVGTDPPRTYVEDLLVIPEEIGRSFLQEILPGQLRDAVHNEWAKNE